MTRPDYHEAKRRLLSAALQVAQAENYHNPGDPHGDAVQEFANQDLEHSAKRFVEVITPPTETWPEASLSGSGRCPFERIDGYAITRCQRSAHPDTVLHTLKLTW